MKTKLSTKLKLLLGFGALVIVGGLGTYFFYQTSLAPLQSTSEPVDFVVAKGETVGSVITRLKELNLIKNEFMAKVAVKLQGLQHLKRGGFVLDRSWSTTEILKRLNDLPDDNQNTVTITFQEGLWARDFANLLAQHTNVGKTELLNLWNDPVYLATLIEKYEFLTNDILNKQLKVNLEGYLAPNTYEFYQVTTAEAITERLLDQTKIIYDKYRDLFQASSYSIHELFTLASITQFEAGTAADDPIIAGIWYNRLKSNMPLQSSVTVCYALYDYKTWQECERNTRYESPFNTYKYAGIPPGPVAAPGETAILAVLKPQKTDYYYFIAAVYTDGKIHYAKTYREHEANIAKYLAPYR